MRLTPFPWLLAGCFLVTAASAQATDALSAATPVSAGTHFFEDNARAPGIVTLPEGVQYRVLAAGEGVPVSPPCRVVLSYTGSFLNGAVFGSTRDAGGADQPAAFSLERLIPGLRMAVSHMRQGDRWEVFIPAKWAVSGTRRGFEHKPLVFDVRVVAVL